MSIRPDTNTSCAPTKVDNGMSLAGNQHITDGIMNIDPHLPYSAAQGFPLHDQPFNEGESWSQVEGQIHPGSGPANHNW